MLAGHLCGAVVQAGPACSCRRTAKHAQLAQLQAAAAARGAASAVEAAAAAAGIADGPDPVGGGAQAAAVVPYGAAWYLCCSCPMLGCC
jgi:hypothetical protein